VPLPLSKTAGSGKPSDVRCAMIFLATSSVAACSLSVAGQPFGRTASQSKTMFVMRAMCLPCACRPAPVALDEHNDTESSGRRRNLDPTGGLASDFGWNPHNLENKRRMFAEQLQHP